MEDAAAHGGSAAKWALGLGAAAAGGWVLWELMKRQGKKAPTNGNAANKDKIEFQPGSDVTVGSRERLSRESDNALAAQPSMSR